MTKLWVQIVCTINGFILVFQKGVFPDLLATSGDYLRVWRVGDTETRLECLLNNVSLSLYIVGRVVRGMSIKFVDSLSTAQHKQSLVFFSYIIIFSNVSGIHV